MTELSSVAAYPYTGSQGGWSLSQLTLDERWDTPWTDHQTIKGLTLCDRQPLTLTFTSMGCLVTS